LISQSRGLGDVYKRQGTQLFFFPYKIIQHVALKREGTSEAPIWSLTIRTAQDKINLQSSRNLDAEFAALCMHFH
jgi:hypothetical protein